MKYGTLRNLRYVAVITALGMIFGMILAMLQSGASFRAARNGALDAFLMAGSLAVYHMFVFRGVLRERIRGLSFAQVLLFNSLVYVILLVGGRVAGGIIGGYQDSFQAIVSDPYWGQTIALSAGLALVINFAMQLGDLIGRGELIRFLSGRYHRPRSERRVFLFLDLTSSTSIAEKIGDELFLDLLDRFYSHMTEVILRTRASIYKYVGDEIIISWTPADAARNLNCLRFAALFQEELDARQAFYRETYGLVPRFRAAVHAGTVMTGEMGDLKKEIVYLGDVLNTTARVTELCRSLEQPVLATGEVMEMVRHALPADGAAGLRDLGEHTLRGKEDMTRVFAVNRLD